MNEAQLRETLRDLREPLALEEIREIEFPPIRRALTPYQKRMLQQAWKNEVSKVVTMSSVSALSAGWPKRVTRKSLVRKGFAFEGDTDMRVTPNQHSLSYGDLYLTRLGMIAAARLRWETLQRAAKASGNTPLKASRQIAKEMRQLSSRDTQIIQMRSRQEELTRVSEGFARQAVGLLQVAGLSELSESQREEWEREIAQTRSKPSGLPAELSLRAEMSAEEVLRVVGADR